MISQFFGIGDCIFAQGVANHFIKEGYEVIWPVKHQFLQALQRAYPKVTFVPSAMVKQELFEIKEDIVVDGVRIFPMRWSDRVVGADAKYWMRTKFDLAKLDYTTWKNHAMWKRDGKREVALFYEVYGLERKEKFNLINIAFRSDASKEIEINVDNGLKNVIMGFHDGFSLFDHALLIERAENIHVANSAIFYLLELLEFPAKEVHLYARTGDEVGFPHVDYLMTKNYILH